MTKADFPFGPHAAKVLEKRYLAREGDGRPAETPEQMLRRVADAVAAAESIWGASPEKWADRFFDLMHSGLFLPNSPTLMNAGRELGQLSACFVIPVEDDLDSIFQAVKHTALIHKSGGGTGFSFSRLRPAGDEVASTGGVSSGPVSFIKVFDSATEAIKQGGARRGANMGVLWAGHPDIELFIKSKMDPGALCNFNISVMAPDAFMKKALAGEGWELKNPRTGRAACEVEAAGLLGLLAQCAHASGEPGMAFYDTINQANPTPALGVMEAVNPCGEQPLLPYESCNLGSLVLPRFAGPGGVDYAALEQAAMIAVRFLDDVVEVNRFPLKEVSKRTGLTRKVGLGVMGLADLFIELGLAYDSPAALEEAGRIMAAIQQAARQASRELARERGSFPAFPLSRWRKADETRMRNATVTTIAPTGTLSLLMGCSSGIEPLFALSYTRRVLEGQELSEAHPGFLRRLAELGLDSKENLERLRLGGRASAISGLPAADEALFATAHDIPAAAHLNMQAAFQAHTDNGVSKTVNLPRAATVEQVREIFIQAHRLGLKGVTVFRDGCRGRQVLELAPLPGQPHQGLQAKPGRCPRCGGIVATDGGCRTCTVCGASGCE